MELAEGNSSVGCLVAMVESNSIYSVTLGDLNITWVKVCVGGLVGVHHPAVLDMAVSISACERMNE